jgi:MYXO-CTERM domain-containing protein
MQKDRAVGGRRLKRAATTVVLALVAMLWGHGFEPAGAADNGRWSVFPTTAPGQRARAYVVPTLKPGIPVHDSVTITNRTDAPLALELFPADAYNTPEGGFASRPPHEPRRDMAAWIELSRTTLSVPAHETAEVAFTINPPRDAAPGDHVGSIVAVDTVGTVNTSGSVNVRALDAVGVRVYGRVSGPLTPELTITELSVRPSGGFRQLVGAPIDARVSYKVVNTGNVRLEGDAVVEVKGLLGKGKRLDPHSIPELLPRGSAIVHQDVTGILAAGRLRASVTITADDVEASSTTTTWAVPWIAVAVVLLALAWLIRRRRRRHRRFGGESAWSEVDEMLEEVSR